jgi:c-di-GMP-binding flagellar brake protein YcgR
MTTNDGKPQRADNVENLDQFMLYNKGEIAQRLRQLAKDHCMVTAYFDNGATMNTRVIDLIREMELVVLDYGVDEKLVQQLLQSNRVIFKSQHDGVTAQFTATSLTRAKYQNEPVIAAPMPTSLLWVQRRQSYRVRIPLGIPSWCKIPWTNETTLRLKIYDISGGGLALVDEENNLHVQNGVILENCTLELPEFGTDQVNLRVCSCFPNNKRDPDAGQRIGCAFSNLGMSFGASIQRYINSIETLCKRTED